MKSRLSRRAFAAAVCTFLPPLVSAGSHQDPKEGGSLSKAKICLFSKHLQWLNYDEMAHLVARLGFDGIDLTVRPGGHVLPENVEDDLPKAVAAARSAGIEIPMMTTAIQDASDPTTRRVLETASQLGIRHYRMGYYRYPEDRTVSSAIEDARHSMTKLASLNQEFGIKGGYQNHSGSGFFGAPLWDLREILQDLDSEWIGIQFDIRHATVEGGQSWSTDFRSIKEWVHTLVFKDFFWERTPEKWVVRNCPLGQGMVNFDEYLTLLRSSSIPGPFSLHLEYPLGGADRGARELTIPRAEVKAAIQRDLSTLKSFLRKQ